MGIFQLESISSSIKYIPLVASSLVNIQNYADENLSRSLRICTEQGTNLILAFRFLGVVVEAYVYLLKG